MAREPDQIALLRRLAMEGDVDAQFSLGEAFRLGARVARDTEQAVTWLGVAARSGHGGAKSALASLAAQGIDVSARPSPVVSAAPPRRQSLDDLLDSLRPASGPEGDGGVTLPLVVLPEPDPDPLFSDVPDAAELTQSAQAGDAAAQVALGNAYRLGDGVPEDEVEAVKWYRLAAQSGDARGAYSLGVMLEHGWGTRPNQAEAVEWYRRAAEQGDAGGQFNLGNALLHGRGCQADPAGAIQWLLKAAEQGDAAALFALGAQYEKGGILAKNESQAADLYRRAAEKGDADAQYNLSNMLRQGRGVEIDPVEAAAFCRRAAEQGNGAAQFNYAVMALTGIGMEKDEIEAHVWMTRAAQSDVAALADKARRGAVALAAHLGEDGLAQSRRRLAILQARRA